MKELKGVLPVVQLPYHMDESIDWATFHRSIDWQFECGVDGITIAMVSEVFRLTDVERDQLVAETVNAVQNRGPVVVSTGAESCRQAIRHTLAAEVNGADASMVTPPMLTKCGSKDLKDYYTAILQSSSMPLIIQDASGYMGNAIPTSLMSEIYHEHPDRVFFKPEAQPLGPMLSALRDATGGKAGIFEGSGGLALVDNYRRGIIGSMPGGEIPWAVVALWNALQSGDTIRAREIHFPLVAMVSMMHNLDAFVQVEKLLLKHQGIFKNTIVRGPVGFTMDSETEATVIDLFDILKQRCQQ